MTEYCHHCENKFRTEFDEEGKQKQLHGATEINRFTQ